MPIPARAADTTADAERVQVELLRAVPVSQRLRIAFSLSATVITTATELVEGKRRQVASGGIDSQSRRTTC